MITIQTGTNLVIAPDGTPTSGTITLQPIVAFKYDESGGNRRKVGRGTTTITIIDGVMVPVSIDVAPTSDASTKTSHK